MRYLFLCLKGVVVGAANIIPGVSGGTIAVVLGVFDEMIESINHLFKDFKKSMRFLIPLGIGAIIGILALGSVIDYCFTRFSFATCLFFAGLVVGTIPLIYKKAATNKMKPAYILAAIVGLLVVVALSLLRTPSVVEAETAVRIGDVAFMFFGGVVAAIAMVVPGISGSFVLVLLGLYPTVLRTVAQIKDYLLAPTHFALIPPILVVAVPLGLGIVLGIFAISKIFAFLLQKYFNFTYYAILGLMLGTIFAIFNDPLTYQSYPAGLTLPVVLVAAVMGILGAMLAFLLGKE